MSLTGMLVTSANFVSNLPHEMILLEETRYVSICSSLRASGSWPLTHWSRIQNNSADTNFQLKIPLNVSQGRNIAPIIKGGHRRGGKQPAAKIKESKSFIHLLIEPGLSWPAGLPTLRSEVCSECTGERGKGRRRGREGWQELGRVREIRPTLKGRDLSVRQHRGSSDH